MTFNKSLWYTIIPALLFPWVFLFTQNEFIVAGWVVILTVFLFSLRYERKEWILFLIGLIAGIIAEVGGDMIAKMQYWNNGSLLGIPLWLPLLWAFGFIVIRRIGNMIVEKK
jgi:hypothetical protein